MNISRKLQPFIFSILSLFLVLNSACAQKSSKTTIVSGKVIGLNVGTAKLVGVYADQNFLADTAKLQSDGSFKFERKEGYADGFYYMLLPNQQNFQIIIADGENPVFETSMEGLVNEMHVKQSKENSLFYEVLKYQLDLEKKFDVLAQQVKAVGAGSPEAEDLKKKQQKLLDERDAKLAELWKNNPASFAMKFKMAGQNPKLRITNKPDGSLDSAATLNNYRTDWWNDVDFNDSRFCNTPVFFNKMKKYILELTPQNNDSIIASADKIIDKTINNKELFKLCLSWIAFTYKPASTTYMDGEAIYSHLVNKYYTKEKVYWETPEDIAGLHKTANQMTASVMGAIGQNVTAEDKNGVKRSLYDIKSDYVLVYIYNYDCEHCQKQTPELAQFLVNNKSKGIDVFSIAANCNDYKKWTEFQTKYGIVWTDVWDPRVESRYHEKYYIDITPEIYVLNKDHRIIGKNLKVDQLPDFFKNEFAKVR